MKYLLTAIAIAAALSACSRSSELHESMETMGGSFKAMRNANQGSDIQTHLAEFKAALSIAKAQPVRAEDQAEFDEGMQKLETELAALESALAEGDAEAAAQHMKALGGLRKEYHDALGVK